MIDSFDADRPGIKERVIGQNRLAFAFLNQMPIVPGHVLICPHRVIQSQDELTLEEWKAILDLQRQTCHALREIFQAEGFNFAWNWGSKAGQTVPHFHLHILPRKTGDTGILQYEPRAFLYRPGSRAESPFEELEQIAELLKSTLR